MATRAAAGRAARKTTAKNPTIAVDVAVLTLLEGDDGAVPGVLEVKRVGASGWSLPGVYAQPGEPLADAAARALSERAGLQGAAPRQLLTLDPIDRDDRDWVVSVAYLAVVPADAIATAGADTRVVAAESPGRLPFGHGDIVAAALDDLRSRYGYAPDPDGFLPESFTLRELRLVHEAVAGYELQRDTFRRTMEPLLTTTGQVTVGGRGRPAELFARA